MSIWRRFFGRWLLAVLLPCWIGQAVASVTFKGMVVEHRERGEPAVGVEINADGANQTRSTSSGQFTLVFPDGKPGQAVRLIVQRPGWVVVNSLLLQSRLPDRPDSLPLELVICRAAEREQRLMDFYGLKGNQFAEQNYRRQLAEMERQNKATAAERDRLQRELEAARKQSEAFARQFASQADTELSELNREALQLFQAGRFAEGLQRLSEERLQREAADVQKKLAETAQSYKMRAQMLVLNFDFEGAGKAYGGAIKLLPHSYDVWHDYANFHQQLLHFREAQRGHEQALRLARENNDRPKIASTLNDLGLLHQSENRPEESRQAFEHALKIYQELAIDDPDEYRYAVAGVLSNLGLLHAAEHRREKARQVLMQAANTLSGGQGLYLSTKGDILHNLGLFEYLENNFSYSKRAYEEALAIRRELANGNRNVPIFRSHLAMTLSNLGNLHYDENRLEEARRMHEEALKIYRELADRIPAYRLNLASALNNWGNSLKAENRLIEARKAYEEALEMAYEMVKSDSNMHRALIAVTLVNLGLLYSADNYLDDARQAYEKALNIYRELVAQNPSAYLPGLAWALGGYGDLNNLEQKWPEARAAYQQALGIFSEFAQRVPHVYNISVKKAQDSLDQLPP